MKKISAIALTTYLSLTSLSVYAFSDDSITVWIPGDKGYNGIVEIGKKFTEQTGVKIIVEHPDRVEEKFPVVAAAGDGPDIMIFAHDRFGGYAEAGLVMEIEPSDEFKAKFEDFTWKALNYKGKYFGYPISAETLSLIYNKDLISKPMKNWEEVFGLDKTLSSQSKKAIMWDIQSPFFSWPLITANGAYSFKSTPNGYDTKNVGVNTEGAKKSMTFLIFMSIMQRKLSKMVTM